jgi:hypothetical protein
MLCSVGCERNGMLCSVGCERNGMLCSLGCERSSGLRFGSGKVDVVGPDVRGVRPNPNRARLGLRLDSSWGSSDPAGGAKGGVGGGGPGS